MKKRLLILLTAFILCITGIFSVSAAESATLTVSSANVEIGATFDISFTISKSEYATYGLDITYDKSALELIAVEKGPATKGMLFIGNSDNGRVTSVGMSDTVSEGLLFTATFKVITDVEGTYTISADIDSFTKADAKTNIDMTVKSGTVKVTKPACKHTFDKGTVTVEPGCETKGELTRTCTKCGMKDTSYIEPTGHKYDSGKITKEPTCTKKGEKLCTCTVCGQTKVVSVDKAGHTYGAWEVTKAPSCIAKGEETRTCTVCGDKDHRSIAAAGHKFGEPTVTKEPTCVETGTSETVCSVCGKTEVTELPTVEHNYGEWAVTKEPTCSEDGLEERACTVCGYVEQRAIAKTGVHSFGEWTVTKEPTCSEAGEKTRTCACGHSETEALEKLEHSWEWVVDTEPTTEQEGVKHEECKHCSAKRNENTPIEKLPSEAKPFPWWIIVVIAVVLAGLGVAGYFLYKKGLLQGPLAKVKAFFILIGGKIKAFFILVAGKIKGLFKK